MQGSVVNRVLRCSRQPIGWHEPPFSQLQTRLHPSLLMVAGKGLTKYSPIILSHQSGPVIMEQYSLPALKANYATALNLIDEAHARDPNKIPSPDGSGEELPYELHYARKMTRWLAPRCPDASPTLQLACRAQHFRRYVDRNNHYWGRSLTCTQDGRCHGTVSPRRGLAT